MASSLVPERSPRGATVRERARRSRRSDPNGLAGAGHGMPASLAHPFYWAPFAVVGEERGRTLGRGNGFRTLAGL